VKDDKEKEIARGPADTEGELRRLVPSTVPLGMRRRVLDSALNARLNAVLTPGMRALAVACTIVIVAALAIEPLVGRHEAARMTALLDGRGVSNQAGEEARLLWAEVGGDLADPDKFRMAVIVFSRLGSRHESRPAFFEARDRWKGMIDHEDPENFY